MIEWAWFGLALSAACLLGFCARDFWRGLTKRHVKRLYIAGKVTGEPDENRELFRGASEYLRRLGYETASPHDYVTDGADWEQAMRECVAVLVQCDGVVLLDGWKGSKGATFERHVAETLGIPVFDGTESVPGGGV